MLNIQQAILSLACGMAISVAYSCEPASIDLEMLYANYDLNHDQMIDQKEWQQLIELKDQPVSWQNPASANDPKRMQVFLALDHDHNGVIDPQELGKIYRYFSNPCLGWGSKWGI
ncbi:EF-hand domain-containing protein [Acinetobacter sp. MD2(2019)]|uniref:EF-hand domain-containing protein n=1 Tax=Acinetobacter sp. MD2(2019) TaxID=2605273 RepID=UPI002D1E5B03|nr:EF-hand domain-containing protein [Acinetobacter sp. MD2(2019)]MEB3753047.1 EF-hand domain-containing protein [Acinetobacter sp. MD2(2019)]